MGCGSRAGKMEMHNAGKPFVKERKCVGCALCTKNCAHDAITITDKKRRSITKNASAAALYRSLSPGCDPRGLGRSPTTILNKKIAEYSKAVLDGRPHFHISLVIDVAPFCDCHPDNDLSVIPDVGMFASFDPVALDVACADAVNAQPVTPGSLLDESDHEGTRSLQRHQPGNQLDGLHRSCGEAGTWK